MKIIILPFLFLIVVTSCNSQKYEVEEKLYECLKSEYKNKGIDLDIDLDSLENLLISNNKLNSNNGIAKLEYYKSIAKTGEAPTLTDTYLTVRIKDNYIDESYSIECLLKQIDSSVYLKSNFHIKSQKISKQVGSYVTVQSVAKAISQTYTAKDFEHPLYRLHMLISFIMVADKEQTYIRNIPKQTSPPITGEFEMFNIRIDSTNRIFVHNKMSSIKELHKELKTAIDNSDRRIIIKLNCSKRTEYGTYVSVQEALELASLNKWDELSNEKFEKAYNELSDDEKEEIKKTFPIAIIEDVNQP